MHIHNDNRSFAASVTGVQTVDLQAGLTHHQIAVEGATGDVTVKFRPAGFAGYQDVDDNTLTQNTNAVFEIGSHDSVELTPSDTGAAYSYRISSF